MTNAWADRTALVMAGMQNWEVDRLADDPSWLAEVAATAVAARAAGVLVVHAVAQYRPGYPELSDRIPGFAHLRRTGNLVEGSEGTAIPPVLGPEPTDVVIVKRRAGAFAGTELDLVLRAQSIDTLVVCGLATSGSVLSTVRAAADNEYRLMVLHDLCLDHDAEVQRVLVEKVFPRSGEVLTSVEWRDRLVDQAPTS